jgi:hypothetical protein
LPTEDNAHSVQLFLWGKKNNQCAIAAQERNENKMNQQIDMGEFQSLCAEAWKQRAKVDELTRVASEESKKLEELKAKVLAYFEQYELEKQHVPGFGTISVINRFSVKVPQGDNKLAFFEYLKETGIFEAMATVHSQTLNSWFKEKQEAALNEGNLEFSVPGIDEAKLVKTIGFRKG